MQLDFTRSYLGGNGDGKAAYFIPKGNTELKENDKLLMISDNDL